MLLRGPKLSTTKGSSVPEEKEPEEGCHQTANFSEAECVPPLMKIPQIR
jgi:hypothetical protein